MISITLEYVYYIVECAGWAIAESQTRLNLCMRFVLLFVQLYTYMGSWGRYLRHATLLASVQQIGYIVKWQVYILSEEDRLLYKICRYDHTKTLYKIYSFLRDFSKISAITQVGTG